MKIGMTLPRRLWSFVNRPRMQLCRTDGGHFWAWISMQEADGSVLHLEVGPSDLPRFDGCIQLSLDSRVRHRSGHTLAGVPELRRCAGLSIRNKTCRPYGHTRIWK